MPASDFGGARLAAPQPFGLAFRLLPSQEAPNADSNSCSYSVDIPSALRYLSTSTHIPYNRDVCAAALSHCNSASVEVKKNRTQILKKFGASGLEPQPSTDEWCLCAQPVGSGKA